MRYEVAICLLLITQYGCGITGKRSQSADVSSLRGSSLRNSPDRSYLDKNLNKTVTLEGILTLDRKMGKNLLTLADGTPVRFTGIFTHPLPYNNRVRITGTLIQVNNIPILSAENLERDDLIQGLVMPNPPHEGSKELEEARRGYFLEHATLTIMEPNK